MLRKLRATGRFAADRHSNAAIEFAIVLPIMLLLLAGVYDFSEAFVVRAEVYDAADAMAASASSLAIQQDGSTALTYDQVQLVESSIWALVPALRGSRAAAQGNPKSVTISSVLFFPQLSTACGVGQASSCQYVADLAWSEAYAGGGVAGGLGTFQTNIATADCNQVFQNPTDIQVSPTTNLSGTDNIIKFRTLNVATDASTFPAFAGTNTTQQNEAGVAPILVVTIQYTYTPLFSFFFVRPYTFWVDGYWPVRSVKAGTSRVSGNVTIQPLANQFTTLVGNPSTFTPSGSDVNANNYCVNKGVFPYAVSAPVT
jgi:hypothetical protein